MRRVVAVVAIVAAGLGSGHPARAGVRQSTGCAQRFPSVAWEPAGTRGGASLSAAGLDEGIVERAGSAIESATDLMQGHLVAPPAVEVCVFGAGVVDLDPVGAGPPDERVHAVVFAEEAIVAVDAQLLTTLEPSITFGLAYAWLWHTSVDLGLTGYPEPLATAVAQWYRAHVTRRLDDQHVQIRTGLFFADPEGDDAGQDWVAGVQGPVFRWNPQFNESPIGDIIQFAMDTEGPDVLMMPTTAVWADIDADWRFALREELLQGATGERSWRIGLGMAIGVVVAAAVLALLHGRAKRRDSYRTGETAPIPGFFEDDAAGP